MAHKVLLVEDNPVCEHSCPHCYGGSGTKLPLREMAQRRYKKQRVRGLTLFFWT